MRRPTLSEIDNFVWLPTLLCSVPAFLVVLVGFMDITRSIEPRWQVTFIGTAMLLTYAYWWLRAYIYFARKGRKCNTQ